MSQDQLSFDAERPVPGSTRTTVDGKVATNDLAAAIARTMQAGMALRTTVAVAVTNGRTIPIEVAAALSQFSEAHDAAYRLGQFADPIRAFAVPDNGTSASKAAAYTIAPKAGTLRLRVLAAIAEEGSASDARLEEVTNLKHQTLSARRRELVLGGFIESCGKLSNGANAWCVTDAGRRALGLPSAP